MEDIARKVHDVVDDPDPPHPPGSPLHQALNANAQFLHLCARHVLQAYPGADMRQLYSFIENASSSNGLNVINLALNAIHDGLIMVAQHSPGSSSSKRKHIGDHEGVVDDRAPNGSSIKRVKVDYSSKFRPRNGGPDYNELAVEHLHEDFSYVEESFIRSVFKSFNSLYAPTHLFLLAKQTEVLRRSRMTAVPPLPDLTKMEKGKRRALQDAEFARERDWLLEELSRQGVKTRIQGDETEGDVNGVDVEGDDGQVVECGCCFSEFLSREMSSCPEKHLFCRECITRHCSNLLLVQKTDIKCISTEGCESFFSPSALRRSLPDKQYAIWERLNQRQEIADAGLVLEDCPFCDFACVIWDDQASTFVCGNTEICGKQSCRGCKKLNHLPKTCQEVIDDEAREGRHIIAEAMTRALMRNCPNELCKKPFIKEGGCNKMKCPFCGTLSCYLCRKPIVGYDHFNSARPGPRARRRASGKCPLFDSAEENHNDEVRQAAAAALEQVMQDLPHVEQDALQVDLPPPPRQIPSPQQMQPGFPAPPFVIPQNYPFFGAFQAAAHPLLFAPPPQIFGPGQMQAQPFAPQLPMGFNGPHMHPQPLQPGPQVHAFAHAHPGNHVAPAPPVGLGPNPGPRPVPIHFFRDMIPPVFQPAAPPPPAVHPPAPQGLRPPPFFPNVPQDLRHTIHPQPQGLQPQVPHLGSQGLRLHVHQALRPPLGAQPPAPPPETQGFRPPLFPLTPQGFQSPALLPPPQCSQPPPFPHFHHATQQQPVDIQEIPALARSYGSPTQRSPPAPPQAPGPPLQPYLVPQYFQLSPPQRRPAPCLHPHFRPTFPAIQPNMRLDAFRQMVLHNRQHIALPQQHPAEPNATVNPMDLIA